MHVITVSADHFQYPISRLVEQLRRTTRPGAGEALPRKPECDYATTIILLTVVMFESYLGRVRHFDTVSPHKRATGFEYFQQLRGRRPAQLVKQMREVFDLRDIIAHGHVWDVDQRWTERRPVYVKNAALDLRIYGSKGFPNRVTATEVQTPHRHLRGVSPTTRSLRLHVLPLAIDRSDARKVFACVVRAMRWLEREGHLHLPLGYLDNVHVPYGNELSFCFVDLENEMV